MPPLTGSSLDGYSLIKKIGEGGFGEVWLSKSDTTGAWKALKWVSKSSVKRLDQKLSALSRYSNAVSGIRSPHLGRISYNLAERPCHPGPNQKFSEIVFPIH
jgi:serine/threonine protein kinase